MPGLRPSGVGMSASWLWRSRALTLRALQLHPSEAKLFKHMRIRSRCIQPPPKGKRLQPAIARKASKPDKIRPKPSPGGSSDRLPGDWMLSPKLVKARKFRACLDLTQEESNVDVPTDQGGSVIVGEWSSGGSRHQCGSGRSWELHTGRAQP